jgi:hypothetical protein
VTTLRVGQLDFDLDDRPVRCGIHGDVIRDGRCETCDGDRCVGLCRERFKGPRNPEMPPGPQVHGRCYVPKGDR